MSSPSVHSKQSHEQRFAKNGLKTSRSDIVRDVASATKNDNNIVNCSDIFKVVALPDFLKCYDLDTLKEFVERLPILPFEKEDQKSMTYSIWKLTHEDDKYFVVIEKARGFTNEALQQLFGKGSRKHTFSVEARTLDGWIIKERQPILSFFRRQRSEIIPKKVFTDEVVEYFWSVCHTYNPKMRTWLAIPLFWPGSQDVVGILSIDFPTDKSETLNYEIAKEVTETVRQLIENNCGTKSNMNSNTTNETEYISLHYARLNDVWKARTFYQHSSLNESIVISTSPISATCGLINGDSFYWNLVCETREISWDSFPALCDREEKIHYFYPDRLNLACKTKDQFQKDMETLNLQLIGNIDDCSLTTIYPVRVPKHQNLITFTNTITEHAKYIFKISAIEINPFVVWDWD